MDLLVVQIMVKLEMEVSSFLSDLTRYNFFFCREKKKGEKIWRCDHHNPAIIREGRKGGQTTACKIIEGQQNEAPYIRKRSDNQNVVK